MKRSYKRKFHYFEVGSTPPGSGVTILAQVKLANQQNNTIYRIKYKCCGSERELEHKSIVKRQQAINNRCRSCLGYKHKLKTAESKRILTRARTKEELTADYGVISWPASPPTWTQS